MNIAEVIQSLIREFKVKQLSFRSIGNSGDNDSVYIHPKTAPPLVNKYIESRVIDLTIGFIEGKIKKFAHS